MSSKNPIARFPALRRLAAALVVAAAGLSLSQRVEFDCAHGGERVLQTNTFSDHNLDGATGLSIYEPGPWTWPAPNTANDAMQKIACAATAPSQR